MRLPLWFSPRFFTAGGAVAAVLACAPGWHGFVTIAIAAGGLLALATLYDALRVPGPRSITVRRMLPRHFALRTPAMIRYSLENRSSATIAFELIESPMRVMRFVLPIAGAAGARAENEVEVEVTPVERGNDRFGTIYLRYRTELGLIRRHAEYAAAEGVRVYPDLSAVERYGTLHLRNRLIEAGLRRIRMRGIGTEFESLREYAAGDSFRSVDWKATARRGKVMVAQREVERSQDVVILLDCGRLMTARIDDQRKLDYAVTAGLSVASIAALASDRVGLVAFSRDILVARSPRSAATSVRALADALCDVEPRFEEADYAKAFAYLRGHLHRRSLIVFFTDVIDPLSQSAVLSELASLAHRHVVLAVFMNDAAVRATLERTPRRPIDAYRLDVALGLAQERKTAAGHLQRANVGVIDVPARALTTAAIDEYLRIKQRGLL